MYRNTSNARATDKASNNIQRRKRALLGVSWPGFSSPFSWGVRDDKLLEMSRRDQQRTQRRDSDFFSVIVSRSLISRCLTTHDN